MQKPDRPNTQSMPLRSLQPAGGDTLITQMANVQNRTGEVPYSEIKFYWGFGGGSLYANDVEKEDSKTFVKEVAFKAVFEFWGELDR